MEVNFFLILLTFFNGIVGHAMPWALPEGDYEYGLSEGEYDDDTPDDCSKYESYKYR